MTEIGRDRLERLRRDTLFQANFATGEDRAEIEAHAADVWALLAAYEAQEEELGRLIEAVNAKNVLTCVYCGTAYPPGSPRHGSSVLTAHIMVCPKHPLREAEAKVEAQAKEIERLRGLILDFGSEPIWNDHPANDSVKLDRIYRILNQHLSEAKVEAQAKEIGRQRDEARAELAEIRCELRKFDARDLPLTNVEIIKGLGAEVVRLRGLIAWYGAAESESDINAMGDAMEAEARRIREEEGRDEHHLLREAR
jgi:hypothetical protein